MKPKPFRLDALLEERVREKDQASRALAIATERHAVALLTLADVDARLTHACAAISDGLVGSKHANLRDAYAIYEAVVAARPLVAERLRIAAEDRNRQAEAQRHAAQAWKAIAALKDKALAAQRAYEEQLEDWELGESNLTLMSRSRQSAVN